MFCIVKESFSRFWAPEQPSSSPTTFKRKTKQNSPHFKWRLVFRGHLPRFSPRKGLTSLSQMLGEYLYWYRCSVLLFRWISPIVGELFIVSVYILEYQNRVEGRRYGDWISNRCQTCRTHWLGWTICRWTKLGLWLMSISLYLSFFLQVGNNCFFRKYCLYRYNITSSVFFPCGEKSLHSSPCGKLKHPSIHLIKCSQHYVPP